MSFYPQTETTTEEETEQEYNMLEWLKGKKTYIICAAGILTALGAYLSGSISLTELISAIYAAFTGMSLRAAVTKGKTF